MSGTLTAQSLQFIDGVFSTLPTPGTMNDGGNAVTTDSAGNVYVTGYIDGPSGGLGIGNNGILFAGTTFYRPNTLDEVMYIGKIDPNGVPLWLRTIEGVGNNSNILNSNRGQSISIDNAGNLYVIGYNEYNNPNFSSSINSFRFGTCTTTPPGPGSFVIYNKPPLSPPAAPPNTPHLNGRYIVLLKLDTTGNLGWLRTLDYVSTPLGTGITDGLSISTNGTDVYFTGYTINTGTPLRYMAWSIITPPATAAQDWIKPTTFGDSAIIGKINASTGALTWLRLLDTNDPVGNDRGKGISVENGGDVLITGFTNSTGTTMNFISCFPGSSTSTTLNKVATNGNDALFLLRLDSNGAFMRMNILDSIGTGSDVGNAITVAYEPAIKIYVTGVSKPLDTIMRYSSVIALLPPIPPLTPSPPFGLPQTWNIILPPFTTIIQETTLIAKIDFGTGNLEWLNYLVTPDNSVIHSSTGIAVSPNFTQAVYVSGYFELQGGPVYFGKASTGTGTAPVLIPEASTASTGLTAGFILELDTSGNKTEFKQIYATATGAGSFKINGISLDNSNNIYIIGDTRQTSNIPPILFADDIFTKPITQEDSAFIGKLKNLSPFPPNSTICYAKGTLIGTDRGFVPIEDIKLSDKIRTYDRIEEKMFKPVHGIPFKAHQRVLDTRFKNKFANIKFIGHFTTDATHEDTAPICITAGALGENQPERDLFVSPNHSMLVDDRMIFAKDMVNEITIYQDMSFETIEYYHILSDDHYIINANGALSETLGTEELKLFESMIYAQSKLYEPLVLENKYHLQDITT